MNTFSFGVARANPELTHMRVPVLSLGILFLFLILIILVIAFLSAKDPTWECFPDEVGEEPLDNGVGHAGNVLPLVALYIYTERMYRLDHQSLLQSQF